MPSRSREHGLDLTLVTGGGCFSEHGSTVRAAGPADWSVYMTRAQGGNKDAYRRLLEDITPYLRSLAARHFPSRGDVEDAVQEILLTVHAIRHTYDPARPFGPWLIAIASRRIVDGLRRQGRTRAREVALEAEHETFPTPQANLPERASDGRALRDAVERLPSGQRDAIRMLKLQEMSLKEAAAALKVATHRGLRTLKRMFGREDKET